MQSSKKMKSLSESTTCYTVLHWFDFWIVPSSAHLLGRKKLCLHNALSKRHTRDGSYLVTSSSQLEESTAAEQVQLGLDSSLYN